MNIYGIERRIFRNSKEDGGKDSSEFIPDFCPTTG